MSRSRGDEGYDDFFPVESSASMLSPAKSPKLVHLEHELKNLRKFCSRPSVAIPRRRHTTLSSASDCARLPLHVKKVAPLHEDFVCSLNHELVPLFRMNRDASFYGSLLPDAIKEVPDSKAAPDDISAMLKAGYLEETTQDEVQACGTWFTVNEQVKNRRRGIFWPRGINDWLAEEQDGLGLWQPDIGDTLEAVKDLHKPNLFAACFDLSISFFQCELSPEVRPFYAFKSDGRFYRLTRMPMGQRWAAFLMHAVTETLAYRAAAGHNVKVRAFVDNVRFLGDEHSVRLAATAFKDLCHAAGVTLNDEEENAVHQRGDFLGLHFDYARRLVRLSAKTEQKIKAFETTLTDPNLCLEACASGFGLLYYASRVLRLPLAQFYWPIKFYRKRMSELANGKLKWSSKADLWRCIRQDVNRWVAALRKNTFVGPDLPTTNEFRYILATDASITGYGGVLFDQHSGEVRSYGGKWHRAHKCDDINTLEGDAVSRCYKHFRTTLSGLPVLLLVDNTSVVHCLKRGHAREYTLNKSISHILDVLQQNPDVRVCHIDTELNPADDISRGKPLSPQLTSHVLAGGRRYWRSSLKVAAPVSIPLAKETMVQ